jgi:F-type H+-transporting ATPase subunit epsilon
MENIYLEIITPERIVFRDKVDMITAPSALGVIGILPGHVPLFTRLTEGEVKISTKDKEIYLAIGSGFMEISQDKASILVTSAYKAEELNEKEVLEAKKRAEEALLTKPKGAALVEAQALFRRSIVELRLIRKRKSVSLQIH